MKNKYAAKHALLRVDDFYYVGRVPLDLAEHYSLKRLCFSLRTKYFKSTIHVSKSVSQRLEDYWLGLSIYEKLFWVTTTYFDKTIVLVAE